MLPNFHLSMDVKSIEESVRFFTDILQAKVLHRDPSGYVNIDFFGSQITLKQNEDILVSENSHFHFGVNMELKEFNDLSSFILKQGQKFVVVPPEIWDGGTPLERKKMYLKCPTGYLIELKGYKCFFYLFGRHKRRDNRHNKT